MLLPILAVSGLSPSSTQLALYVGTYTSKEGSQGIYRVMLDPSNGEFSSPTLAVKATSPSFLAVHPSGRFLYAVNESSGGDVSAFAIRTDGQLSLLNTQNGEGGGPCHVSTDRSGEHVFMAAYGDGTFATFPVQASGALEPASDRFRNKGKGPDASRQEGPHGHSMYLGPDGRHLYGCDLGTDEILVFRFDSAQGKFALSSPRAAKLAPGSGPRHLAFHPSGRFAYVNGEMANDVTAFSVDPSTGALRPFQTLRTLPAGISNAGKTTAEIACHPNGRWLYVSNRGHDSIAVFNLDESGQMRLSQIKKVGVRNPRSFAIDPSGRWLVVAGQNSGDLASFSIGSSGKLASTGHRALVDKPVCVVFAAKPE